ncbi:MAG: hypothetical protein M3Q33_15090, partial [Acidobacteriota bacterium]|nr:hypothetical protein [Acidobacteriota bacterium]
HSATVCHPDAVTQSLRTSIISCFHAHKRRIRNTLDKLKTFCSLAPVPKRKASFARLLRLTAVVLNQDIEQLQFCEY